MIQSIFILIVFCIIGIVPGFLLYKIILKKEKSRFYEYLPISFCLSLAIFIIPTFLAYYFGLSLNFVIYFFSAAFLWIIILFIVRFIGRRKSPNVSQNHSPRFNIYLKILLLICLIVFIRAIFTPGFESGDSRRYISEVRKIIELPNIVSGSTLIKEFKGMNNYGYNVWYMFLAALTKLSRSDIIDVWRLSPVFLTFFMLLAFFFAAKELFNSEKIAVFATSVFFIREAILGYDPSLPYISNFWPWAMSMITAFVARDIVILVVLAFCFKYIRNGDKKFLYITSASVLVLSFVHFYYFMILLLVMGSCLVFGFIFRHQDKLLLKRLAILLVIIVLPSIFYVYYVYTGLMPVRNPLYLSPSLISSNQPVEMVHGFPVIDPFKTIFYKGFIYSFALLLVPLLIFFINKKRYYLYLLAFSLGPLLVIFNPPLVKILQKFNPSLERVWRLSEILPFNQIFGLFLCLAWERTGSFIKHFLAKQDKKKIILVALMMGVIILTMAGKSLIILYLKGITEPKDIKETKYLWDKNLREIIHQEIIPGSVVLTDNFTPLIWVHYYPHYIVSVNWGADNYIPPQFNQTERYDDVEAYMQQKQLDQSSFELFKKYNVDYILVNKHIKDNNYEIITELPDPFYKPYSPKTYYSDKDFAKYPNKFELVYSSSDIAFYRLLK